MRMREFRLSVEVRANSCDTGLICVYFVCKDFLFKLGMADLGSDSFQDEGQN